MGDNDVVGSNKGSSSVSTQGKGIRNKRKYLTDVLLDVPLDASSLSLTEFPRYELLEQKLRDALREALEARRDQPHEDEFQQAEWDDPLISQFEELLSKNLFATYQSAIKKIVECGYDEQTAESLILRTGLFHGSKDVVSNIVDGALAILKRPDVFDTSRHHKFENLQSLVEYTMLEMICVLREVKPSLTVREAMWYLLICDLNLSHACAVNGGRFDGLCGQEIPEEKLVISPNAQSTPEASKTRHTIPNETDIPKPSDPSAQSSQYEIPKVGQAPQLSNSRNPCVFDVGKTGKEGLGTLPETAVKSSSVTRKHVQTLPQTSAEEKSGGSRKGSLGNSKRDMLRQKTFHLEKSYKGRMSKGAFKAKFSALGNMVLDKTLKSTSSSSGVAMTSTSSKITTSIGANGPLSEEIHHHTSNSSSLLSASDSPGMLPMKESGFALPAVNTQIPAPSAVELKIAPETKANIPTSSATPDYYAGIPYEDGKYVSRDEKDEIMLLLVPHMQSLQKELQSWSDWANEKIMQATSRLSKDLVELRTLRQEKEEAEKFKKEKQTWEENTIKRLSEMEHAWSNANSQIEFANSSLRTLEAENSVLRQEMEAARLQALESATSLEDAMRREQEALKNSQSWGSTKSLLQEELTTLKRNAANLERQLDKAEGRFKQIEALQKKEEKEKAEALTKAKFMRGRREQQEALLKAEEDDIRQKSESDVQKCREEIKKLENEISVLRFESDSSRIAALRSGIRMDYGSCLIDSKSASPFLGFQFPTTNKRLPVFCDNFGAKSIKQERECVMCLTEEMSIVFLPCAHQVLCAECNVQHEKQGMNECPSCRTLIQRRIQARFTNSLHP